MRRLSFIRCCRANAGPKSYTVAYVQYFDRELERNNGDWKALLREYLFPGPEPLINGFCGGRTLPSTCLTATSQQLLTR
jgi:hypothetical protein